METSRRLQYSILGAFNRWEIQLKCTEDVHMASGEAQRGVLPYSLSETVTLSLSEMDRTSKQPTFRWAPIPNPLSCSVFFVDLRHCPFNSKSLDEDAANFTTHSSIRCSLFQSMDYSDSSTFSCRIFSDNNSTFKMKWSPNSSPLKLEDALQKWRKFAPFYCCQSKLNEGILGEAAFMI